ncbi:MAG: hypothetical protein VB078_07035 [Clostridiaceae bacterium]|nr:hypothetical protein [Clostridiaceae bacterium]
MIVREFWNDREVQPGDPELQAHLAETLQSYFNLLVRTDIERAKSIFRVVRKNPDGTETLEKWE